MDPNGNQLAQPDVITIQTEPLHLPIQDEMILSVLNDAEQRGKNMRAKFNIDERASLNTSFWKGKQVDDSKLDARYQQAHTDNVIGQDLENKIKLATSHMPDIFVAPPDRQEHNMEAARDLQQFLRERLDSGTIKRLLKNGLRKLDLELIFIIKARWDAQYKDFCFELVNSSDILFGEGAVVKEDGYTIDGTDVLFHYVEDSTQNVLNTFKDKAQALLDMLGAQGQKIPSRIRYTEAHFKWYGTDGAVNEGIAWRYGNLILGKMKQPYFDYQNKQNNYFDFPRKPFIIGSYRNLGDSVYESATDFEWGVPVNRIINTRRRQITEIADRAVPKMVFTGSAMDHRKASNINPSPNEAVILNDEVDDITKAFTTIPATPPSPVLYNDLLDLRGRLNSLFSVQGATNVEAGRNAGESGISKQITREGDLVTSDDITAFTVERVVSEMAGWAMQLSRMFFDDDRPPLRITDRDGETEYVNLTRQKIETDVQVIVRASSQDKQTRRADALQLLDAKAIDPYTLMEDLDVNNPKERFRRLMAFTRSQQTGDFSAYFDVLGIDPNTHMATEQDAIRDIEVLSGGQQVMIRLPSEKYVSAFMAFRQSPEFARLPQYSQVIINQHIQRLRQAVDEEIQRQQAKAGVDTSAMATMTGGAPQSDMGAAFAPPQQTPLMASLQQGSAPVQPQPVMM